MVTIASLTFSITIVTLQLASSQFGPRLLRNFVRDRGNQVALGTFIATFTYCLLILRTVNGTEDHEFVPHLSVTVGLPLTLASLGVLIYFIHHTANVDPGGDVIASVGDDLHEAIDRRFPSIRRPRGRRAGRAACPRASTQAHGPGSLLSDYVQVLDGDGCSAWPPTDLVLAPRTAGDRVVEGR